MDKSTFYALEMLSLTGTHIQKTEKSKKKKRRAQRLNCKASRGIDQINLLGRGDTESRRKGNSPAKKEEKKI